MTVVSVLYPGVGCIVDSKQTVFYIQDEAGGEQTERARPGWNTGNTCSASSNSPQPSQAGQLVRSIPITIKPAQSEPEQILTGKTAAPGPATAEAGEGNEKEKNSIKAGGEACFSPKIRTIPIEILDCGGEQKVEVMSTVRTIPIQRINPVCTPHLSRTSSGESESFPSQKIKMGTSAIKIPIQVS